MFPIQVDTVRIYRGDDVLLGTMELTDDVTNQPISLAGHAFQAQWRPGTESDSFVPLVVDSSQANQGKVTVSMASAQSALISQGGVWDLQSTQGGQVRTWMRGRTTFMPDVTR